jgi:hypothetical protein
MEDSVAAYTSGIFSMVFVAFMFWHMAESMCQATYDVHDCEWSQSPFTPKVIETTIEGPTP